MVFKASKFKGLIIGILITLLLVMLISKPNIAKSSAFDGLLLSGKIIIPSLFPFMVGVLLLSKSGVLYAFPFPKKFSHIKLPIIILVLSLIGGYPIGAKIISDEYSNGSLSGKDAELILLSSINAGPSFTILTVGCGIFNSPSIGIILFCAQTLSALIIFLSVSRKITHKKPIKCISQNFTEAFVNSVSDSSAAMLNICGYIVVASTILGLLKVGESRGVITAILEYTLEISNAVLSTKNIYFMAAILGFGSFSIIFQVIHICRKFSPSVFKIILSRITNSVLSIFFTFLLLKIFPQKTSTFANTGEQVLSIGDTSVILLILLIATIAVFLHSVSTKKFSGKINADIF